MQCGLQCRPNQSLQLTPTVHGVAQFQTLGKQMKRLIAILTLCLTTISAFAVDVGDMWRAASPNNTFLAATRRTPETDYIWRKDLDGTKLVVFKLSSDSYHDIGKMYFQHTIDGRILEQIAWTTDSKYIVFTTSSSGGHSPWHYTSYVVSILDHKILSADDFIGLVVSPEFEVVSPHTVVFGIGTTGSNGVDFDHPRKKEVDLSTLFRGTAHKQ